MRSFGKAKGGLSFPPLISNKCSTGESPTFQRYKNYVPIDYIKGELIDFNTEFLLHNNLLDFGSMVNEDTGELIQQIGGNGLPKKINRISRYKNLVFKYYPDTKKMYFWGSLHIFYNNGEHNYNDFDYRAFLDVLKTLKEQFGILPCHLKLTQIEWGVNIVPPIESNVIIEHSLFHLWEKFEAKYDSIEGKYYQWKHSEYILKLYNKALQYNQQKEILRFERKQISYLNYTKLHGIGQTLQDLIESGFIGLKETLLKDWKDILFFDPFIENEASKIMRLSNPKYWKKTKMERSRTTLSKHVHKLQIHNAELGNDIQRKVSKIIESKIDELSCNVLTFSPFSYTPKPLTPDKGVSVAIETEHTKKRCLLTGVDISMQRRDSKLLSHAGLKYLLWKDSETFVKMKKEHLTTKWLDSDLNNQIKEIAHNIRTKHNDKERRKQHRMFVDSYQYNIFSHLGEV